MIFCFQPGVWHFLGDSAPLRPCVEERNVSTCPDLLQYPLRLRETAFASVRIVDWPLLPKHGYPPPQAGKISERSLRSACKPHSVQGGNSPGRLSLWAAYPELKGDGPPPAPKGFVPAWPCSRRGLPGRGCYHPRRWSLTPPFHHYQGLGIRDWGLGIGLERRGEGNLFPVP